MAKIPTDGKTRIIMVAAACILVFAVMVGIWSFKRAGSSDTAAPPSSTVAAKAPTDGTSDITTSSSKLYDGLLQQSNAKNASEAAKTGASAMPVIRGGVEKPEQALAPTPSSVTPPPTFSPQAQQANEQRYQADMVERQKLIQSRKAAMTAQLTLLKKAWNVEGHLTIAVQPAVSETARPNVAGAASTGAQTAVAAAGDVIAHAGDTMVARLDTPIDTDSPLPIYKATIVEAGPLHNAVLLGTIQATTATSYGAGVPFTFTQIIIPGQAAQSVSGFAINAADAGALKGQKNSHVFQRYSAAFGGAFLQGVGTGLLQGGRSQQVITSATGYAVQSDAFTNKQLLMLGAANVGQMAATQMAKDINRPPTITMPGGTTIAIFFTADLPATSSK